MLFKPSSIQVDVVVDEMAPSPAVSDQELNRHEPLRVPRLWKIS